MATTNANRRSRRPPGGGAGGSRRALLVAINDYGSPQNNLPSCLEDAAQVRSVLQSSYGFETFTELYDGDATVANMESGLAWLFENAAEDHRLVFFYSGHGYQQPRNGNLEECLVLSNMEFFFDDRLSELSQSAPPGVLTVVLDSCFSGGMQKPIALGDGVEIARTKLWMPPPGKSAAKSLVGRPFVPRPFGCFPVTDPTAVKRLVLGPQASPNLKAGGPQAGGEDEASQLQLNGLLLSACSENETASAATSATEGLSAFTYALRRTLPASGEISVTQLHEGARAQLAEMGFRQTPLLRVPASPAGLASSSFVTLAPAAAAAGQPAKALPAEAGGDRTTTVEPTEDGTMTDQQAYDQQFWRTVERVAAQVVSAAGNQAPAQGKSFAPPSPPAAPPPANGQDGQTAGPTTRPANPMPLPAGPASGPNGGTTSPAPQPGGPTTSAPAGDGSAPGEEKWIGAALSVAAAVAPHVINAIRGKDFTPDLAAGPEGEEKLASSVAEVVTPAIIDAIASRPKDFDLDLTSGAPSKGAGDGAGGDKFPWGAVARVAASAVPAIVAEVTKKEFTLDQTADPAASDQKFGVIGIGAVAHAMINAWRNRRKDLGPEQGDGADDKFPWGAAARVAASIVPPLVGALTGKIYQPQPGRPQILPMPANGGEQGDRRYYIAS